jgi:hypothetical protein
MQPSPAHYRPRTSLRAFLLLVAAFAIACASLKFANEWWLFGVKATLMLAIMASAVVMVVDRGPRQAFACGFAISAVIYCLTLLAHGTLQNLPNSSAVANAELDADRRAELPTTNALQAVYSSICQRWFVDGMTGRRFRLEELPPNTPILMASLSDELRKRMGTIPLPSSTSPPNQAQWSGVTPDSKDFMMIGHSLWAILFGYLGGHFACYVYWRRLREHQ